MVESKVEFYINKDIKTVWEAVTNNKDYKWRSDLSKIEVIDDKQFIEFDKNNFPTYFKITKSEYLKRYEFQIENQNIRGTWIGIFEKQEENTTKLEFIEQIEVNSKLMKLLAKPYLKSQQKRYMKDLKMKLEKN